jgi:hypothetical protein
VKVCWKKPTKVFAFKAAIQIKSLLFSIVCWIKFHEWAELKKKNLLFCLIKFKKFPRFIYCELYDCQLLFSSDMQEKLSHGNFHSNKMYFFSSTRCIFSPTFCRFSLTFLVRKHDGAIIVDIIDEWLINCIFSDLKCILLD